MPFWEIYTPKDAFTDEDKETLTQGITSIYYDLVDLPKFYVVVVFHEMPRNSIYVGGEAANNFIRIRLDHIARKTVDYIEHHTNKKTMVNGIALGSLTSEQIRADFHEKVEEVLVPVRERARLRLGDPRRRNSRGPLACSGPDSATWMVRVRRALAQGEPSRSLLLSNRISKQVLATSPRLGNH